MRTLRNLMLLLLTLFVSQNALAWGSWGHSVVAYIAEKHLTEEAKTQCQHYLKHTLPYYSSWQDHWRYIPEFVDICNGHMSYVNKDLQIIGRDGDITFDAVTRLEQHIDFLNNGKYRNHPDSIVALRLKLIIHTAGDMHCPSHIGYSKDCGLKGHSMLIRGKKVARHTFWDRLPQILHPMWKLENFAEGYDTYNPKQIKKICKGDPTKWGLYNARKMVETYSYWDRGQKFEELSAEQHHMMEDLVHEQIAAAGYRLAHILNTIFKPEKSKNRPKENN